MAQILRCKPSLKVGIYGSYYPRSELERLERLRDAVRREDYSQAYMVKDLPDLPQFRDPFDKSIFSLMRSNVNLFVLTFRGQKQGAVRELDYILRNPEHVFKCAVFIESEHARRKRGEARCLSTMLESDLRAVNMRVLEFDRGNDVELLDLARGTLLDFLYYYIRNRPHDLGGA